MKISRRSFLAAAAAVAAGKLVSCGSSGKLAGDPFQLGVASGDPSADGVVLWTRLALRPLEIGGAMPPERIAVAWEIAEDESFAHLARSGDSVALPELAHAVHVELSGLRPDRPYWYRFRVGDAWSPVGRTRTAPAPDAAPAKVRFGVASCNSFQDGHYTAFDHMAAEDFDLVLHLGDYIYENASPAIPTPKPGVPTPPPKPRRHLGPECMTLDGYRQRYAQYKTDPALQKLHAAAPWVFTPDDHEFDNNCAGAIPELPKPGEPPVSTEDFLKRRAAAYQAMYENMPLRLASRPKGPDMQLFRRIAWGRLADFFVLDTRQYRTDQPSGDGNKPPAPEQLDPKGSLMGAAQRDWLFDGVVRSGAGWNVLAQQVMTARADRKPGEGVLHSMDQWPGYEFERRRLLKHLHDRKIGNAVALAGDIHTNWANDLVADFDGLDGRVVASEFVGTSISSGGDGLAKPPFLDQLLADNPFVKFHNAERGYLKCTVDAKIFRTDFRTVPFVVKPGAPVTTRASFAVEAGNPGVKPA